jgi:hypothetical protein
MMLYLAAQESTRKAEWDERRRERELEMEERRKDREVFFLLILTSIFIK